MTEYVRRWSVSMRLVHWALALSFLGLIGSGLALESPELRGIPLLGSKLVREVHLTFAVLLAVLPTIAGAWDDFRDLRVVWRESTHFDGRDLDWLSSLCGRVLGSRRALPGQGRLNAGQKLNTVVLVLLSMALALTGATLAPEPGRPVPQAVREVVYEIHRLLAYVTLTLVAAHIVLGGLYPPTRPALRGLLMGSVRSDWARTHHARWLAEVGNRTSGVDKCSGVPGADNMASH